MKRKTLARLRPAAFVALGVFLGRGAQADTILDFDIRPVGQANNAAVLQSFGDNTSASSDGVTVSGFGTPNVGLTWQATGGRWDHYLDSVWSAGQLDSSNIGDLHELVFTPNNPLAAVVVKSFNFHPYYISSEKYSYDVSVLAGTNVLSGPTNITFLANGDKDHPVTLDYTGAAGQTLTLRLARVTTELTPPEIAGSAGNIAVDDITFAQFPETEFSTGPQVISVTPANNQAGVAPDYFYRASITNGTTALASGTIQLRFNGSLVSPAPAITADGGLTTVSYEAAALLPTGSTNRYTLTFEDDGVPAKRFTNEVQYIVVNFVDIKLPPPIVLENFDGTAEGSLPAGWTGINLDTQRDPTSEPDINVANLDSAAYTNWTVVNASRFTNTFDTYSQLFNNLIQPPAEATDYRRVLSVNPANVANGVFVRNLASGAFVFGNSGYRADALGQIGYLFSPDFDLTGKTNVYLSYHSLWEQNQDSIGAVEYSIDMGMTWQPIVYMLNNGSDVATNLDGSIDALTTFTNVWGDVARYIDSGTGETNGGFYGAFIGVDSNRWSTLAPFISRRVDDNNVESKRIEIFRLPLADNQAKVRLRFAHAGTDSWYFGVDNVGLYSLPAVRINSTVRSGNNLTISWNGAAGTKLQKTTSLGSPNWQDVPASNGANSVNDPLSGVETYYRLVRPY